MITGIGHVAFCVTSLQRALDFYCNKLGFRMVFGLEQEGQPSPWIVYIQLAPGSFLELFPDRQDAPGTISAPDPQASYKHVCLLVDDLPATLRALAQENGSSLAQIALAWVLRKPIISAAIIGATRPQQVKENAGASEITLIDDVLQRIDEILGEEVFYTH
jgi:catechol 2,3-dioxygenase-like lactoylglutathione lyase family enzyme